MDPILEVKGLYKVFEKLRSEHSHSSKKALIKTIFLNKLA